ncbi:portal protein [Acidomonas methanolica]|uniref:Portal protein n=1 Tax=Acidomonas methanolica NBRC 104435 TaxID=1231351 RepID=A0A023D6G2_ACIMT|nr:portal protein [Acidomonas methanolica]TCS24120.1 phage P22-like portal protein [Acidomonas methanolica]GAJ29727.1 hypothetical protein Amme_076_020 [Acidomonas methanolica NBRC 104435]GEL00035.1 portal protein [Acidomonas methanolica NBRC 104435]
MNESPKETDADIIREVKERFTAAQDYEAAWRRRALDDLRFFHADAYNHGQWDDAVYQARVGTFGGSPRPCLTINKTAQHVFQVENQARQTQMGIKVNAVGFGATAKAAEVIEGVVRHIECQSNAQQNAYNCAIQGQVRQGLGWVHITTDYIPGVDTFDQDFFINAVSNPLSVYADPNTTEPDHSDQTWAMICEEMDRAEFDRLYPGNDDIHGAPLSIAADNQHDRGPEQERDIVRVFRYYRRSEKKDRLWLFPGSTALGMAPQPTRESEMSDEQRELCRALKAPSRPVTDQEVEFFLIAGDRVISSGPTVFKLIPLVPWIGIETVIEGRLDRKGLVRSLVDAQRMFNYTASAFVESVALQTKAPWVGPARAFESLENEWANANVSNAAFLPYNDVDDDGAPIAPPTRVEPPTGSTGHLQGMQSADQWMQMVTGQYQAEMGAPGNERSGVAINQRQRQSDTANYHYTDNQGMALRYIGRLLIGALPALYDTQRALQVIGVDGQQSQAVLDPRLPTATKIALPGDAQPPAGLSEEEQLEIQGAILAVNPTVGRYDVEPDVGPAYATQRQEAFAALTQVLQAAPALMGQIGDLVFKAADFPLADEIADRLKPASDDPRLALAQQQLQQAQATIAQLQQQIRDKQADIGLRASKQRHDAVMDLMDQDTKRRQQQTDEMAAIGSIAPESLKPVLENLIRQILAEQGTPNAPVPPSAPGEIRRLPSDNPPGGEIHAPNPVIGAIDS